MAERNILFIFTAAAPMTNVRLGFSEKTELIRPLCKRLKGEVSEREAILIFTGPEDSWCNMFAFFYEVVWLCSSQRTRSVYMNT